MPTKYGHFRLIPFRQTSTGVEHMALIKGEWSEDESVLVRVHSSCATGRRSWVANAAIVVNNCIKQWR